MRRSNLRLQFLLFRCLSSSALRQESDDDENESQTSSKNSEDERDIILSKELQREKQAAKRAPHLRK